MYRTLTKGNICMNIQDFYNKKAKQKSINSSVFKPERERILFRLNTFCIPIFLCQNLRHILLLKIFSFLIHQTPLIPGIFLWWTFSALDNIQTDARTDVKPLVIAHFYFRNALKKITGSKLAAKGYTTKRRILSSKCSSCMHRYFISAGMLCFLN